MAAQLAVSHSALASPQAWLRAGRIQGAAACSGPLAVKCTVIRPMLFRGCLHGSTASVWGHTLSLRDPLNRAGTKQESGQDHSYLHPANVD